MTTIKILDAEVSVRIEWLRSFLAVTETGSFTRAARAVRRSQPAVSTHVRELETNLGARLFEHVGHGVRLTRSGEAVAREARRILDAVRDLRMAAADSAGTVQGLIKIGASTTPGNYFLPGLLARFERLYPRARTTFTIGNSAKILDLLRVNEIDLGVTGLEPDPSEFVSRKFARDEIVLFAAADHPLSRRRRVSLEDLSRERFLLREKESATRRVFEAWLARHKTPAPVMELGCPETVKRAAAAGLGVGVLSKHAIAWEVSQRRLAVLRGVDFRISRWLFTVVHRRKHVSRTIEGLLEVLGEAGD
jgi:DNA-binding transcriptional LysR family regulator